MSRVNIYVIFKQKGAAVELHRARPKIKLFSPAWIDLPDGYLNLREVVCHILFVPRTIDVAEAWITTELHSLLLDMAQHPCHRLGKTIV